MFEIYGVVSDQHFHNWSAFSEVNNDGINSRLAASIAELFRCADTVKAAGGKTIINAGDTFHVRGSVAPSVFNPVMDAHQRLIEMGFEVLILAGNHDIEHSQVSRLGNSVTALESVGCRIINEPCLMDQKAFVPWYSNIKELKAHLESLGDSENHLRDLIIHAPIDGVICGLPDHGITSVYLANLGFKRVLSGHYHNHKDFGNGVYSIGSTSHLTWSDVGSKAGFLIVHEDRVERFASHAPEFIDLDEDMDPDDVPLIVQGNFVRAKVSTTKTQEINELRSWLMDDCGARGVVINSVKAATKARTGSVAHSVTAGASIEASISAYVKGQSFANADKVQIECQKILSEVGV